MNLNRIKLLLDKIKTLHTNMSADPTQIATIERDLMLTYIRQLYDAALSEGATVTTNISSHTVVVEENETIDATPTAKTTTTYKPRIIEIPDSVKEDIAVKTTKSSQPTPLPSPRPTPTKKTESTPQPQPTPKPTPTTNSEHEVLFQQKEARELSEKLSQRPISDLPKSISFNDNLLYLNQLFDKDSITFNEALRKLNNMANFDAAKPYIAELADRYNWTNKPKVEKAKEFIKLVRRRYL